MEKPDDSRRVLIECFLSRTPGEPANMADYRSVCLTELGLSELPDSLIDKLLERLNMEGRLKVLFPTGYKCCLAIIPFNNNGNPLDAREVADGTYLVPLIFHPETKSTIGFGTDETFASTCLPSEVQALSFDIPAYENDNPFIMSDVDREKIYGLLRTAFAQLKQLFRTAFPN